LTFKLERIIELDHRVWSLPELVTLFNNTGWQFQKAYPGFATGFTKKKASPISENGKLSESPMLLIISRRPE
jgi:hypothetical protein